MPAPAPPSQQDNSAGMIWGVAAAFAAVGMIWFAFKNYIVAIYLTIKLYEVNFLSLFSDQFTTTRQAVEILLNNTSAVTLAQLLTVGNAVGDTLRYPFMITLLILAVIVYFGNATRVFKRTYSMQDLAKIEQVNWPQISPAIDLDLIKTDIDKGPWAMAMTPMQFCKRFRLLEEIRPQRREGMSRREWDKIEVVLKRGEANKIFALQLGPLWRGTENLPPHTKALFAAFAARINADSKAAEDLLRQLAATAPKLNLAGVDALLKKHENTKLVKQITSSHAYVLTVMASMLAGARDDGVQAPADFLWLKPVDRRLWYVLNTVGRQTPFAEVAGVFAHWLAEKEAGKKILVPMVEEASKALEIALKEVVYKPDEVSA